MGYMVFEDRQLVELKCMKCDGTIGKRREDSKRFVRWNNYRAWPLRLKDGSYQNMLVCEKCLPQCNESCFDLFNDARRWGWIEDLVQRNGMSRVDAIKIVKQFAKTKEIVGIWE